MRDGQAREHILVPHQQIILLSWLGMILGAKRNIQDHRATRNEQAFNACPHELRELGFDLLLWRSRLLLIRFHKTGYATNGLVHDLIQAIRVDMGHQRCPRLILAFKEKGDLVAINEAAFLVRNDFSGFDHRKLNPLCVFTWLYVAFARGPTINQKYNRS